MPKKKDYKWTLDKNIGTSTTSVYEILNFRLVVLLISSTYLYCLLHTYFTKSNQSFFYMFFFESRCLDQCFLVQLLQPLVPIQPSVNIVGIFTDSSSLVYLLMTSNIFHFLRHHGINIHFYFAWHKYRIHVYQNRELTDLLIKQEQSVFL